MFYFFIVIFYLQITTLPVSLFTLPALSELKLDNNELSAVPPDIKCMTNLRRISSTLTKEKKNKKKKKKRKDE
jgi:hypothetical protein